MKKEDKITQLERCSKLMLEMLESYRLDPCEYAYVVNSVVELENEIRKQKVVIKYTSKNQ